MSTTLDDAKRMVLEYLKRKEPGAGCELVLLESMTTERDFGWVFFYDTKRHTETGDFRDSLAGNAPIVVTRVDGEIHLTGISCRTVSRGIQAV